MSLKVCDNDKLEMQPFFLLFVMTLIRVVIPSEYTRPSVCKSNKNNYVLPPLPEERWIHEEGNSQITEDTMLVVDFLRRSQNSNELL